MPSLACSTITWADSDREHKSFTIIFTLALYQTPHTTLINAYTIKFKPKQFQRKSENCKKKKGLDTLIKTTEVIYFLRYKNYLYKKLQRILEKIKLPQQKHERTTDKDEGE